MVILEHVGCLQIFVIDRVVLLNELKRRLMLKRGGRCAARVDNPCRYYATGQHCLQGEKAIHPLAKAAEGLSGRFSVERRERQGVQPGCGYAILRGAKDCSR